MLRSAIILCTFAAALLADSVAGVKWTPPTGWTSQAKTAMRAATYVIPARAGSHTPVECVIYYFGAGQGGSVQANIERWTSQFTGPGGHQAPAKVEKKMVHGLPVTTINTSGNYSGMGGPLAKQPAVEPGYRMLAAIIEGPQGNIFIKFAGPARTIAAHEPQFYQLLDSFQKQ